jgi:hypothetical protein
MSLNFKMKFLPLEDLVFLTHYLLTIADSFQTLE